MQFDFVFRGVRKSEPLRKLTEERLRELAQTFLDKPIGSKVAVSRVGKGKLKRASLHVSGSNGIFIGTEEEADDAYAAIDSALEKLKRRLKRHKSRVKVHHSRRFEHHNQHAIAS